MKDIELPPLPAPFMELHRDLGTTVYDAWATQMQSYARAAVEADRAQRVPDGLAHEKWLQKLEDLIDEFGDERAIEACHGEFHCRKSPEKVLKEIMSLLSSTPAQPTPQPVERKPLTGEQASAMAAYFNVPADYVHTVYNRVHGIRE